MQIYQLLDNYLKKQFKTKIIEQNYKNNHDKGYKVFNFEIDLLGLMKNQPLIVSKIISNYSMFIKTFQKIINEVLKEENRNIPEYGSKISIHFINCAIPKHNIKSIEFLMASLNQTDGILIYLKNVEILALKQVQLYLQSWNQIWEYQCQCNQQKLFKKRITQSLLQIITKGSKNLRENSKSQQTEFCPQCQLSMKFLGTDQLIYDQCQQIQVVVQFPQNNISKLQILNFNNLKIFIDKTHLNKFKLGDIFDLCCYLKTSVEYNKTYNNKLGMDILYTSYLVCFYPQQFYLTSSNNLFFGKIRQIYLKQKPISNIGNINDIVYNYKGLIQAINDIKFPYLQQNTLTALKLVTICSIFSHHLNNQKLNIFIITDQVFLIQRCLKISNLSIKKFPSIYDQKTISYFFNSCQNSIVLFVNPSTQRDLSLINKIIKNQLYSNLNFVVWVICQPQQGLKKKIEVKQFEIVLDLTIQKNLNVCESVYQSMIENYLGSFIVDQQDQLIATALKKFKNIPFIYQNQNQSNILYQGDSVKEDRLANDILRRYFLKSRQYKTTKINSIQILTKIAEAFMQFRYFIHNKGFKNNKFPVNKNQRHYLSIMDAILAIFIDQQTSRNKFSSNNTLFSTDVSKIMLNQNNCNISIWDYQIDQGYVEQNRKYIPRDQLVGIVIGKIFNLIYQDERAY